jgi:hypothetical protein
MNRQEVRDLLTLIEGFERRTFPASAVDAWLSIMAPVEYRDALQAVRDHFDAAEPIRDPVQPGPIKRRAKLIAELRESRTRAIAAPNCAPPNQEYLARRAELAQRFGDTSRALRRPRAPRAEDRRPVDADSSVTNEARNAALDALRERYGVAAA